MISSILYSLGKIWSKIKLLPKNVAGEKNEKRVIFSTFLIRLKKIELTVGGEGFKEHWIQENNRSWKVLSYKSIKTVFYSNLKMVAKIIKPKCHPSHHPS